MLKVQIYKEILYGAAITVKACKERYLTVLTAEIQYPAKVLCRKISKAKMLLKIMKFTVLNTIKFTVKSSAISGCAVS